MKSRAEIEMHLAHFRGGGWVRYPHIVVTDGVHYLVEAAEAYWLLDAIVSFQTDPQVAAEYFQFFKFTVNEDRSAVLICDDGNGNVLKKQDIEYTTFPLSSIQLYYSRDERIACLPQEY